MRLLTSLILARSITCAFNTFCINYIVTLLQAEPSVLPNERDLSIWLWPEAAITRANGGSPPTAGTDLLDQCLSAKKGLI